MSAIESETILPRRAHRQPSPKLYAGGDCAACCLGGVTGLSVPDVYARLMEGKVQSTSRHGQRDALYVAHRLGLIDRFEDAVPFWQTYDDQAMFGNPAWHAWHASLAWFGWIRMAVDAGYYGVASVSFAGTGPLADNDHAVLICGARFRWSEPDERHGGCRTGISEILVSCSAQAPEGRWEEVAHFLKHRGGYNPLLVRPVAA